MSKPPCFITNSDHTVAFRLADIRSVTVNANGKGVIVAEEPGEEAMVRHVVSGEVAKEIIQMLADTRL